ILEKAPAWKPASLSEAHVDDSATTPQALSALTGESAARTPSPKTDDEGETVRWAKLSVKPAAKTAGSSSTRPFAQPPAPETQPMPPEKKSALPLIGGIAAAVVALGGVGLVVQRKLAPPPPAAVAAGQPALPDSFTVVF